MSSATHTILRNGTFANWADNHRFAPTPSASIVLLVCLVLIITKLTSTVRSKSIVVTEHGAKTVPSVSYSMPLIGHIPNLLIDRTGWIEKMRRRYREGIFALNFGGTAQNIMYGPGLSTALLNQKASNATSEPVMAHMARAVFGFPAEEQEVYDAALPEYLACFKHLMSEPGLGRMCDGTAQRIRSNMANLVTFSSSIVDQCVWEREADVKTNLTDNGLQSAEVSLLSLVRSFVANQANPTIMGSNFMENFPDFHEELWQLDRGFEMLLICVPRWLPIPYVTRAYFARRKLLSKLVKFHAAMEHQADGKDPGADWDDLDNVGDIVKARAHVYRKHKWSLAARASNDLFLIWGANANSPGLVFWMLNHVYADKVLLAMLRDEIDPYVQAVQPRQDFPVAEAPQLNKFDVEGLCAHCPLLKSCYVESLRLDTTAWSPKIVQQDFVLQSREKDSQGWLLKKGEWAHAAHDLHNTDPDYFENPMMFKPDRHIKQDGEKKTADLGSIRPYGGGASMCKGRQFAFKECMMFVAAIISMWNMEPAKGVSWKMPRKTQNMGVHGVAKDTRVKITRRELPIAE